VWRRGQQGQDLLPQVGPALLPTPEVELGGRAELGLVQRRTVLAQDLHGDDARSGHWGPIPRARNGQPICSILGRLRGLIDIRMQV